MSKDFIHLPDKSTIDQWRFLEDVQIVETSPRSVPSSTLITYPPDGNVNRIISSRIDIPAAIQIKHIKIIEEHNQKLNDFILEVYAKRGLTQSLISSVPEETFKSDAAKAVAQVKFDELLNFLRSQQEEVTSTCQDLVRIFMMESLFEKGQYTDELLDQICLVIFNFQALGVLNSSKDAISSDLSQFGKWAAGSNVQVNTDLLTIKMWAGNHKANIGQLVDEFTKNVSYERTLIIFQVMYKYLRKKLEQRTFLFPDQRAQYIAALKLIFMLYDAEKKKEEAEKSNQKIKKSKYILQPLKDDYVMFLKEAIATYKLMPLCFDCTIESESDVDKNMFERKKPEVKHPAQFIKLTFSELIKQARKNFKKLSELIADISNCPKQTDKYKLEIPLKLSKKILDLIPTVLRHMSIVMGFIREYVSSVQMYKPEITDPSVLEDMKKYESKPYELNMRFGFQPEILSVVLTLLWIVRSTRELINDNMHLIKQSLADSIQDYLQNFALNILPQAILRNKEYKELITDVLDILRVLLGQYSSDNDFQISAKKASKVEKQESNLNIGEPSLAIVELVRLQLQLLTNKGAPAVSKQGVLKGQPLNSDDEALFLEFLEQSQYFIQLIDLQTTLDAICDQSPLYFKEYYMAFNHCTFFPVTTSLPVILSKHALDNYKKIELSGSIFYPLSIYDDAASVALKKLKSTMLFNEIKAEASICIQYISREIAEKAFNPILKFATLRMMPPEQINSQSAIFREDISSLRLGVTLQQNALTILGTGIDTKYLIAKRLREIFQEKLEALIAVVEKFGLITMNILIAVLNVFRKAHSLFDLFNLCLTPFDDMMRNAFALDNPDTFQSRLLNGCLFNMIDNILSDYIIVGFPLRCLPKQQFKFVEEIRSIFKTSEAGDILCSNLLPSCTFISVDTFRQFFWFIDDGAIMFFHQQLISVIPDLVDAFITVYQGLQTKLKRIQNPPISYTCYQAFDRFEGAYHYFVDSEEIRGCLSLMKQIGNIILLSQMIDNAWILKRTTATQVAAFMFSEKPVDLGKDPDKIPELFELFDKSFQEKRPFFSMMNQKIDPKEFNLPLTTNAVRLLVNQLLPHYNLFAELSVNIRDLTSLKGFGAVWSVLDFISSQIIVLPAKEGGGFSVFGEGVCYCAAAIILLTKQRRLARALSISERVMSHKMTDFSNVIDERIEKYLSAAQFSTSSLSFAYAAISSIYDSILQK